MMLFAFQSVELKPCDGRSGSCRVCSSRHRREHLLDGLPIRSMAKVGRIYRRPLQAFAEIAGRKQKARSRRKKSDSSFRTKRLATFSLRLTKAQHEVSRLQEALQASESRSAVAAASKQNCGSVTRGVLSTGTTLPPNFARPSSPTNCFRLSSPAFERDHEKHTRTHNIAADKS